MDEFSTPTQVLLLLAQTVTVASRQVAASGQLVAAVPTYVAGMLTRRV